MPSSIPQSLDPSPPWTLAPFRHHPSAFILLAQWRSVGELVDWSL